MLFPQTVEHSIPAESPLAQQFKTIVLATRTEERRVLCNQPDCASSRGTSTAGFHIEYRPVGLIDHAGNYHLLAPDRAAAAAHFRSQVDVCLVCALRRYGQVLQVDQR